MTVSTISAAVHITPVVLKTLFKHMKMKRHKAKCDDYSDEATDDIFFDEAFNIVRAFIELGTLNTIESLQSFTNTHVPAPYWAAVSPVKIPLSSCNKAADLLIDWFGPEDLKLVVGGERWWQIRGLDGIDGEWITEKKYLSDDKPDTSISGRKLSSEETHILRMEHLDTVMLYVHGGAYFWGSINTHRYQIIRYARKMKGRAFAVNYRKAPQYPWPCPLQDVLAAYFYLTSPPPDALHKPIPPSKIVLAGDSAGGGLCIAALTTLRDMGLSQPAGAVLISPWVDLTHSFPSVMKNIQSDIIPPHGFIAKPSPLWPVRTLPEGGRTRVIPTDTNPPPKPGHADTLRPTGDRLEEQHEKRVEASIQKGREIHTVELNHEKVVSQAEMLHDTPEGESIGAAPSQPVENTAQPHRTSETDSRYNAALDFWEPKPPKVLMKDPNDTPLELRSQIQIYATTEQLTHPLVSPVLQGSLGNLCPLYIIAGDGEVLRDEIIYLAHKAAYPQEYPTRQGALREGRRQRENAEKFQTPTKVHLQVFDGMCHVLTVFTFTDSAKYAYRSIAQFIRHVTGHSEEHLQQNPFPELHRPPSEMSESSSEDEDRPRHRKGRMKTEPLNVSKGVPADHPSTSVMEDVRTRSDIQRYSTNLEQTADKVKKGEAERTLNPSEKVASPRSQGSGMNDTPGVEMIRERVDIFGQVRSMEPRHELEALQMPAQEIGLIKEDPVERWLSGQEEWDKRFHHTAVKVTRKRRHYEKKAVSLLERARKQGFVHEEDSLIPAHRNISRTSATSVGDIEQRRRWGPLDLEREQPPPSAIAGRRDTREAVALIKMMIYYSAPVTHKVVPKQSGFMSIRQPRQSVAEQQVRARIIPFHGMQVWQSLLTYFMHQSSKKASHGKKRVMNGIRATSEKIRSAHSTDSRH